MLRYLLAVSLALTGAQCDVVKGDDGKVRPDGLVFEAKQISPDPLPLQSVRIAVIRYNDSDRLVAQPNYILFRDPYIRYPDRNDFRLFYTGDGMGYEVQTLTHYFSVASRTPLVLKPGTSIRFSSAGSPSAFSSFFPSVGQYVLGWNFDPKAHAAMDYTLVLNVAQPAGDDLAFYEAIHEDRSLYGPMMARRATLDLDATEELKKLVEKYPRSSYADYARFALARACVKGVGGKFYSDGSDARKFMKRDLVRDINEARMRECLALPLPYETKARGRVREMIDAAIALRHGPEEERDAAIDRLALLTVVSDEDRNEAIRWLEQIKTKDFPYRVDVLILLAKLHGYAAYRFNWHNLPVRWDEPQRVAEIIAELDYEFADAYEWLRERAYVIRYPSQWQKYRVRAVEKAEINLDDLAPKPDPATGRILEEPYKQGPFM